MGDHRSVAYRRARELRAVESFRTAAECIGPVTAGVCVFGLTRGQFSMIDVILHLLNELGGGEISIWTWAIADYEVVTLAGLMSRGDIRAGRLIVDQSSEKRNPAIVEAWRQRFGEEQVRILRNHAKIVRVWNERYQLLVRGSFNLNFNPRTEQFDLDEGTAAFDLVARIEDEFPVLPRNYSSAEAMAAGKLDKAFPVELLAMFGNPNARFATGLRTWQP